MAYIYAHYTKDTNELFYIGKGTGNRAWNIWKRNPYWKNKVQKHGLVVKILHDNLTEEEAFTKEKELITEVGLENLTNIQEGGNGLTRNDAKKLLENPDYRKKHMDGIKKRTADTEWQHKNAEKNKRQTHNSTWIANHAKAMKRVHQDPQWKQKQREGLIKKQQDPEWRRKQQERNNSRKKEFTCISPTGTIHCVVGLKQFCKDNNLHTGCMSYVLSGKLPHYKGWKKYIPTTDIHDEFFEY